MGMLFIVAMAGLGGFLKFATSWPWPIKEASASHLVARHGRLSKSDETKPFTGVLVEWFPNGTLKSRSSIVAGVLEGVSEGWYESGRRQVREHFKAGVSDGLRTTWFEQGPIMSQSMIREGEHHGSFRRWHENGQLAESVEMNRGRPEGISTAYYPSGYLKARAEVRNGQVLQQQLWNDGGLLITNAPKGTRAP